MTQPSHGTNTGRLYKPSCLSNDYYWRDELALFNVDHFLSTPLAGSSTLSTPTCSLLDIVDSGLDLIH
ncbi:hypothetical protein CC2G_001367 [Coprinopsis cinerea AmutBmut pab1-1]|nr:hypothetical protein CC2G_001367 [Coprinopsis cinerea AmutBmut pab1-1]